MDYGREIGELRFKCGKITVGTDDVRVDWIRRCENSNIKAKIEWDRSAWCYEHFIEKVW